MTSNVRHSSDEPRWGTPMEPIEIAKACLGVVHMSYTIDLDPFSEDEFNVHVGAERILDGSPGRDGYKDRWFPENNCPRADWILSGITASMNSCPSSDQRGRTALVNAPGNEDGSNIKNAWRLLVAYYEMGWIDSAMWVAFNLNQLQTLQGIAPLHPLCDRLGGLRCVPDHRLAFTAHSTRPKDKTDAPSHPCFFVLLPSHAPHVEAEQLRLFDSMASRLGAVF